MAWLAVVLLLFAGRPGLAIIVAVGLLLVG